VGIFNAPYLTTRPCLGFSWIVVLTPDMSESVCTLPSYLGVAVPCKTRNLCAKVRWEGAYDFLESPKRPEYG